jgi:hypothetical protein
MINVTMSKVRELADKVTNVVMSYTEVEAKVREATNDEAWGPTGAIMQEITQYTFTYEHFPEVMGMLWRRMLLENKKNWRRVYKSLLLLSYLVRNGSERVITSSREHIYDLRQLEDYTFTDEYGRDQGINVRQKVKELVTLIQDDDALRAERKKAKKNKDKYIGMSGGRSGQFYNDDFDDRPSRPEPRSQLDDIRNWDTGNKSIAEEAIDKVKEFVKGVKIFDSAEDYPNNDLYDDEDRHNYYREDADDFSSTDNPSSRRGRYTDSEPTSNRRTGKSDFSATSSRRKESGAAKNGRTTHSPAGDDDDDFADFESANANGDFADFNPRAGEPSAVSTAPIGRLSPTKPAATLSVKKPRLPSGSDFQPFESAAAPQQFQTHTATVPLAPLTATSAIPASRNTATDVSNIDLLGGFDMLAAVPPPAQPSMFPPSSNTMLGNAVLQTQQQPSLFPPSSSTLLGNSVLHPQQQQSTVASHNADVDLFDLSSVGGALPIQQQPTALLQPMPIQPVAVPAQNSSSSSTSSVDAAQSNSKLSATRWSNANVNIDLDNLGHSNKGTRSAAPSIKQLQQQSSSSSVPSVRGMQPMAPASSMMPHQGVASQSMGMTSIMGAQQPCVPAGMMGMQQMGMTGMQRQPNIGMNMQPGMMGIPPQQQPMGMMGMQQPGMMGMQQPGMMGMSYQPGVMGMPQPGMMGMFAQQGVAGIRQQQKASMSFDEL